MLTRSDFSTGAVQLQGLSDDGVRVAGPDGNPSSLTWDQVISLTRADQPADGAAPASAATRGAAAGGATANPAAAVPPTGPSDSGAVPTNDDAGAAAGLAGTAGGDGTVAQSSPASANGADSTPARFTAILNNGDRILGQPIDASPTASPGGSAAASPSSDTVVWNCPALGGSIDLPLSEFRAIVRNGAPANAAGPGAADVAVDDARKEDTVILANGDQASGIVTAVGAANVFVQSTGDPAPAPMDSVSAILFATAPDSASARRASARRGFRLSLADGSTITVASLSLDASGQTILARERSNADRASADGANSNPANSGTAGASGANAAATNAAGAIADDANANADRAKSQFNIPIKSVQQIDQINGPVSWLSGRRPTASTQTPYWGDDQPWPARVGQTVDGKPILIGDQLFPNGIGVHAYSRLDYELDGHYSRFRAGYAITGDLPLADVTVRILLDGKCAHEQKHVRAGKAYGPVEIDLGNAKTLALEVDFGGHADYQARAAWLDPALVGKKN